MVSAEIQFLNCLSYSCRNTLLKKKNCSFSFLHEIFVCCHLLMPYWIVWFCAVGESGTSTSGRHMPSETDVWGVRGHLGPLKQIKEVKWRTREMNKPLKWLRGWTAQSQTTLMGITQVCMWCRAGWLRKHDRKEAPETVQHEHTCKCFYINNTEIGHLHLFWF